MKLHIHLNTLDLQRKTTTTDTQHAKISKRFFTPQKNNVSIQYTKKLNTKLLKHIKHRL